MSTEAPLPEALSAALRDNRLIVLAGAGISVLPPSSLPSWWGFNQSLLAEMVEAARPLLPGAAGLLDGLTMDRIPVTALSDAVVDAFAGTSYFPVLSVLDGAESNANHHALAELARRQVLQAIVTTNFDTLLERAFEQAGAPYRLFLTAADYGKSTMTSGGCELHKVHGSAAASWTLVDTVTQKLKGLSVSVRSRLEILFSMYHVLVLGFSGDDLRFDESYLPFAAAAGGRGFTWLVRPGSETSATVRRLLDANPSLCSIYQSELPSFFRTLGLNVPPDVPVVDSAARERTDQRVRGIIRSWLQEEHIGEIPCAALCIRLLERIGNPPGTETAHEDLARFVEESRELPLTAAAAYRVLFQGALGRSDFRRSLEWVQRELAIYATLDSAIRPDRAPLEFRTELARNRSAALNNLGVNYRLLGKFKQSGEALAAAASLAGSVRDLRRLSSVRLNMAILHEAEDRCADEVLKQLWISYVLAADAGSAAGQVEALIMRARAFVEIVEFDAALDALNTADRIVTLTGGLSYVVSIGLLRATIEIRRGQMQDAWVRLMDLLSLAERENAPFAAQLIRGETVWLLWFHRPLRERVDAVRREWMEHGQVHGFPLGAADSPRQLDQDRKRLAVALAGELPDAALFVSRLAEYNEEERVLRQEMLQDEFDQRLDRLPGNLQRLCSLRLEWTESMRLKDLARGFLAAAERAGAPAYRQEAMNYLGIAHDRLGELPQAAAVYRTARVAGPAPTGTQVRVASNLAYVLWLLGDAAATSLLTDAVHQFEDLGDTPNAVRTRLTLCRALAGDGDLAEAMRQAVPAVKACRSVGGRPPVCAELAQAVTRWERQSVKKRGRFDAWVLALLAEDLAETISNEDEEQPPEATVRHLDMDAGQRDALAALEFYAQRDRALGVAICLERMALSADREQRWEQSIDLLNRALFLYWTLDDLRGRVRVHAHLAYVYLHAANPEMCRDKAKSSISLGKPLGSSRAVALAWNALHQAATLLEHPLEAAWARRKARKHLANWIQTSAEA